MAGAATDMDLGEAIIPTALPGEERLVADVIADNHSDCSAFIHPFARSDSAGPVPSDIHCRRSTRGRGFSTFPNGPFHY